MAPWCDREVCVYQGEHHHYDLGRDAGFIAMPAVLGPVSIPDPEFAAELAGYATLKPTGPDTLAPPQ